jgi:hypothetical protein
LPTQGRHCGAFLWAFSFLHRGPTWPTSVRSAGIMWTITYSP